MYLSKYNVLVEDFPFNGGVMVYNIVTKGLVFLEDKAQLGELEKIDDDILLDMKEMRMILGDAEEERKFLRRIMDEKYAVDNKLDVTVVTSHACNLRCIYCFEGKLPNEKMSTETARTVLSEIDEYMEKNIEAEVAIRYYGGEPMTNPKIIDFINCHLQTRYGDRFTFSLVSNGVLLTSDIIKNWSKYNWSGIKVTLDGEKTYNDSRRIAKDGKSTYDRVLECLINLPEDIEIFLHIVVDDSNINHLDKMFQDFVSNNLKDKIVIGISYVHPHIDVSPEKRANIVAMAAAKVKYYGLFLSNMISVDGEGICPNKNHNSYLVDTDGKKLKCTGYMAMKECASGIYRGNKDRYVNTDKECLECKYLPVCNGGCQFLKSYNNERKYCQKEYFDALIPQLLKIYVDYEIV
nr:radical SAM protein [uncultured Acetatifactor sp.]